MKALLKKKNKKQKKKLKEKYQVQANLFTQMLSAFTDDKYMRITLTSI